MKSMDMIILPRNREAALLALLFTISKLFLRCESQCTVAQPTITGSNFQDACLVVSQGSLSYTCTTPRREVFWTTTSSVFSESINVVAGVPSGNPTSLVDGVVLTESHNDDSNCVNTTLTFSGSLTSLQSALNGSILMCNHPSFDTDSVIMVLPGLPGSPTLSSMSSILNGQVSLEWAPPANTGGEGVSIERYLVNISGAGYTCQPGQCNVTMPSTTITSLQSNASYTVTIAAVNCVGESMPSDPVILSTLAPIVSLSCESRDQLCPNDSVQICTCSTNGTALRWITNRTGVFDNGGVILDNTTTMHSAMGFSVTSVDDNSENLTRSVLTYSPTAGVSIGDLLVTCKDPYLENTAKTESTTITTTAVPGAPQVTVNTASCDSASGLYQVTLRWSDSMSTTAPAQYYLIDVTSHPEFVCPTGQCNTTAQNTTITGLSCSNGLSFTIRGANCAGLGETTSSSTAIEQLSTPTITKATLSSGIVNVEWMTPAGDEGRSCNRILNYTLTLSHSNRAAEVAMTIAGRTSVSVSVATNNQYSISLMANTNCGTSLTAVAMTTGTNNGGTTDAVSDTAPVVSGLGAAIAIVFLLTAVISSLITLLIAWLYCTKKWSPKHSAHNESDFGKPDHQKQNLVKELEYEKGQDRERVYSYETPVSIKPNPVKELEYDTIVDKRDNDRERVYSYETPVSVLKPPYENAGSLAGTKPVPKQDSTCSDDLELKSNVAYAPTINNAVIEMVYDSVRL